MAERLEKPPEGLPESAPPETTYKTPDPRPHYMELDALRGIAILGVVMLHATGAWDAKIQQPLNIPLLNVDFLRFFYTGASGVTLFFLLSGYLLTWTESKRASKGNYSLRSYALRRVFRLVPAYYVTLAISLLLWTKTPTVTDTLIYLTFLQGFFQMPASHIINPVAWSLTPEVAFYVLLPLVVLKIRRLYQRLILFGALILVSLIMQIPPTVASVLVGGSLFGYELWMFIAGVLPPLGYLWIFMGGVLLRMLVERLNEKRPGGYWSGLAFLLFVGSSAIFVLFPYVPFLSELQDWHIVTDCVVVLFFAAALLGSPVLSRILAWQPLAFVGKISYSLFLFHSLIFVGAKFHVLPPLRHLVSQLDGAAVWIAFAVYVGSLLAVAVLISYLSYRYIESPFLRIKPK